MKIRISSRATGAMLASLGLALASQLAGATTAPLMNVRKVAVGSHNACALFADGTVACWGEIRYGLIGDGSTAIGTAPRITATPVPDLMGVSDVAVGKTVVCALVANGEARCWGSADIFQRSRPEPVPALSGATVIAAGAGHSCAIVSGSVKCWGDNGSYQLGTTQPGPIGTPVTVPLISTAIALSLGAEHSCALLGDGTVRCWGGNALGQLGSGPGPNSADPITIPIPAAIAVAAGSDHTCAATSNGPVHCWGDNASGQLGDGSVLPRSVPAVAAGTDGSTKVAGGVAHACAAMPDGTTRCWGTNSSGELGDMTEVSRATPAPVPGYAFTELWSGWGYSGCGLRGDAALCWGANDYGQLANGGPRIDAPPRTAPVAPADTAVIATGWAHSCALNTVGEVRCWGQNSRGQIGDGSTTGQHLEARVVPLPSAATHLSIDNDTSCAVAATVAYCWGENSNGPLGNSRSPVAVAGLPPVSQVGAGSSRSCALAIDGTVWCWGILPGTGYSAPAPIGVTGATSITVADASGCAIVTGNEVRCWGRWPNGGLETFPGLAGAQALAATRDGVCALMSDGTVHCAGNYVADGCIGTCTKPAPAIVPGVAGATAIGAGLQFTCAVVAGGKVHCWGPNAPLKPIFDDPPYTGFDVPDLEGVVSVDGGSGRACARLTDATVKCWGWNFRGSTGDRAGSYANSPGPALKSDRLPTTTSIFAFQNTWAYGEGAVQGVVNGTQREGAVQFDVASTLEVGSTSQQSVAVLMSGYMQLVPGHLAGFLLNRLSPGTHVITARYLGDDEHLPSSAPAPATFTITKAVMSISLQTPLAPRAVGALPQVFQVSTSAQLAAAVTSLSPVVCSVSLLAGQPDGLQTAYLYQVVTLAAGTCRLTASHPGNANYVPPTPITFGFYVSGPGADPAADSDMDGIPDSLEYAEGRDLFVRDNDVFASSRLFAMQQYRDFLGREGEPVGLAYYENVLNTNAVNRLQVVEAFFASPEFQTGLPQVARLYFSFFNRIPDYGGLLFQVGEYRRGVTLGAIAQNFANAPEFLARYGALTDEQYVDLVYQNVLGRAPDAGGRDYYLTRLASGAITRGQMMVGFSESPEFRQLSEVDVFVTSMYVGLLRRSPEPAGLDFYANLLEQGLPRPEMIGAFLASPEYRGRFLP